MRTYITADNRRAYRVKAIVNNTVLYDVAYNPDYENEDTIFNCVRDIRAFSTDLARQGVYFKPGHAEIVAAGYSVQ